MKKWIIVLCAVFAVALVFISIASPNQEQKDCCLCDSFRYHAPCLIDLETGDLIELDLYFPHETKVGELAEVQEDMSSTFSFVHLGNITGTKLTGSKVIEFGVPIADKTYNPALCKDCRELLQAGYKGRYVLADLYDKDAKTLIPIKADTELTIRCYEISMQHNEDKDGIAVRIQGLLEDK